MDHNIPNTEKGLVSLLGLSSAIVYGGLGVCWNSKSLMQGVFIASLKEHARQCKLYPYLQFKCPILFHSALGGSHMLSQELGEPYHYDHNRSPYENQRVARKMFIRQLGAYIPYSMFAPNGQHTTERTNTYKSQSYQTIWIMLSTLLLNILSVTFVAELVEYLLGGDEHIGFISTVILHIVLFWEKFRKHKKLKQGDITSVNCIIGRELLLSVGDIAIKYIIYHFQMNVPTCLPGLLLAWPLLVLLSGGMVFHALIQLSRSSSPSSSVHHIVTILGAVLGLLLAISSTTPCLEFLCSAVFSFTTQTMAQGLCHAWSWQYDWRTRKKEVESRVDNDVNKVKAGDLITDKTYWFHPFCRAIFVKVPRHFTEIIKSASSVSVATNNVPFVTGNVHRNLSRSSEGPQKTDATREERSQIGSASYNCFTNNYETFAQECNCDPNVLGIHDHNQNAADGEKSIDHVISERSISVQIRRIFKSLMIA